MSREAGLRKIAGTLLVTINVPLARSRVTICLRMGPVIISAERLVRGQGFLQGVVINLKEMNPMKLAMLTSSAFLLSTTLALAGAGAPVPEGSQKPQPSGRPSAVLDDAQCESVWKIASPNGDTLSKDRAVPYVVNFQMVDTSGDAKITQDEFKAGCGKGWIQSADASTVKDMKGSSQN
jgi:hypothetical protein